MIVLDITELVSNPVRTGIQRVVRELICRWPNDIPMRVARFDPAHGLVVVPDAAVELLTKRNPRVVGRSTSVLAADIARVLARGASDSVVSDRVFAPEVFYEAQRCAYHQARLRSEPLAVGFIVYDFIPWLYPERIGVKQSGTLMPYLRLLQSARRVAFISEATRRDYIDRVMRGRGADGPVLPLGSDGFQLGKQTFRPDRRGFLCIGSIDGRKNQDLVLNAFQMLWEKGYDIPLTIVGDAFPQVDVSSFEAAGNHPLFSWHRHADDGIICDLLSATRGTIFASETEGYGLPPVESLYAGVPVIAAASVPSLVELPPQGQIRLEQVTAASIAEAVLSLSDDVFAERLWQEALQLELTDWSSFARQTAEWMRSA